VKDLSIPASRHLQLSSHLHDARLLFFFNGGWMKRGAAHTGPSSERLFSALTTLLDGDIIAANDYYNLRLKVLARYGEPLLQAVDAAAAEEEVVVIRQMDRPRRLRRSTRQNGYQYYGDGDDAEDPDYSPKRNRAVFAYGPLKPDAFIDDRSDPSVHASDDEVVRAEEETETIDSSQELGGEMRVKDVKTSLPLATSWRTLYPEAEVITFPPHKLPKYRDSKETA
jgi:hypothetical protein